MKSISTKLLYATLVSTLVLFTSVRYAQATPPQKPEESVVAEFLACIKDFSDKRTYIQFIDSVIAKVKNNRQYFEEHFKQYYSHLTVDGFIAALQSARNSKNALSAGLALKSYYELLPKEATYAALLTGITRRMKVS